MCDSVQYFRTLNLFSESVHLMGEPDPLRPKCAFCTLSKMGENVMSPLNGNINWVNRFLPLSYFSLNDAPGSVLPLVPYYMK